MPTKKEKKAFVPQLRFPDFREDGEWEQNALNTVAKVVNDKIEIRKISLNDYISTENILPDFSGIGLATNLPTVKSVTRYETGDTLFANIRPYLRKAWFASKDGGASNDVIVFRSRGKATPLFLSLQIRSDSFVDYVMSGAKGVKMPRGDVSQMKLFPLPLPKKKAEQRKIADCLGSLDDLIAAHSAKLAALQDHKKGLLQQLFPAEGESIPALRFPEFREAGEWSKASIQDLIDQNYILGHLDGNHGELYPRAEEFSEEGIPYITARDFMDGYVNFSSCKKLRRKRALQFKKGIAKDGDILFAHNATVGPVAKLVTHLDFVILSTTATYFRCNQTDLTNDFLMFALMSPEFVDQYTRVMSQSTRNQVPITAQRRFNLRIPSISEQLKVASCLSSLSGLIVVQTQNIESLQTHKKSLLQQLFPSA